MHDTYLKALSVRPSLYGSLRGICSISIINPYVCIYIDFTVLCLKPLGSESVLLLIERTFILVCASFSKVYFHSQLGKGLGC